MQQAVDEVVAINLAHDIVTGRCSVDEARREHARLNQAHARGEERAYARGFQFELPSGDTRDRHLPVHSSLQ